MTSKHDLFRLTIDIPTEDHKRLKALAAVLGTSMREIIADWIHMNLYSKNTPNAETLQAIDNIEKGKDLIETNNVEEFFKRLGI